MNPGKHMTVASECPECGKPAEATARKEPIRLQFIRGTDSIFICDQDGRELAGVQTFSYEDKGPEDAPALTVRIIFKESKWDELLAMVPLVSSDRPTGRERSPR